MAELVGLLYPVKANNMDYYSTWGDHHPKIPSGEYELKCAKAEKNPVWHQGQNAWGKSEKIILWFQVFGGDYSGTIIPMFLPIRNDGKVHQGSKYFECWCIANGLSRPSRNRLKEMPPSKFEGKLFRGEVVTVKPTWKNGFEKPDILHYSRVDALYELLVGDTTTKQSSVKLS